MPHADAKWWVILNPNDGHRLLARWERRVNWFVEQGYELTIRKTTGRRHAEQLVKEGLQHGFRQVLVVGGDGTFHEVVNGLMRQSICPPETVVCALLPLGTGNDWRRTHGISRKWEKWKRSFQQRQLAVQDVGKATFVTATGKTESRYFNNVAGMAYDAFVVREAEQRPRRWVRNRFFYLLLIFACLFRYRPPNVRAENGDFSWQDACYTLNVGICNYSGGGMQLVPHAIPDDGQLAVTIAGAISKFGVLCATPLFYNGKVARHPKVTTTSLAALRVQAAGNEVIGLELDGEFVGYTPVEFAVVPKKLVFICGSREPNG